MIENYKIKYLLLCLFSLIHPTKAQVGINTQNPQGVFHLDGQGDTNGDLNVSDDVVVTSDGYIGIGTNKPTTNLDIRGKIMYVDGNQSNNYVLKTDESGNANWAPQVINSLIFANGVQSESINALLSGKELSATSGSTYVGVSISLPPGSWMISYSATFMLDNTGIVGNPLPTNIWWDLSLSSTSNSSISGRVLSSSIGGFGTFKYAPVNAAYFVKTTKTETFYVWGKPNHYKFKYTGEGKIWAMKLDSK